MQHNNWRVYIADAFAQEAYAGNQAGVVILEDSQDFPEDILMRKIAGELKHSETAFVKRAARDVFRIRYFTPVEEVDLCGHATIASFAVLRQEQMIGDGRYQLLTRNQRLWVEVKGSEIWMDMAPPLEAAVLEGGEALKLYEAYGIDMTLEKLRKLPFGMRPKIISTGLFDIILPVADSAVLNGAVQNEAMVEELSRKYNVVGVHMFCLSGQAGVTGECRNFAPLYGILEESATGTANGALTYYLHGYGLAAVGDDQVFLQGEAMGKPSRVKSRLERQALGDEEEQLTVKIGGTAVISLKGELYS